MIVIDKPTSLPLFRAFYDRKKIYSTGPSGLFSFAQISNLKTVSFSIKENAVKTRKKSFLKHAKCYKTIYSWRYKLACLSLDNFSTVVLSF